MGLTPKSARTMVKIGITGKVNEKTADDDATQNPNNRQKLPKEAAPLKPMNSLFKTGSGVLPHSNRR
ncbi:MAG: hypothetical protein ACYC6Y_24915 [Thermoguttaceae bacterium]